MGVREKKREKPKEKEKPKEPVVVEEEAVLEETELEEITHSPEVVVETKESEASKASEQVEVTTTEIIVEAPPELDFIVPSWGDVSEAEWMYNVPSREEDRDLWANEWSDYLLEWTEHKKVHVMSLATFIAEPPFKDLTDKVKAGDLAGKLAAFADGRGGGRPDRAQAGSKKPEKEPVVMEEAGKLLEEVLGDLA